MTGTDTIQELKPIEFKKNKISTTKWEPLIIKYDPVVDLTKGKSTVISLCSYYICGGGIITRETGDKKLVGYCTENPLEVLKITFPEYHITKFNEYSFFSSADVKSTTPMYGLEIKQICPIHEVKWKIEKLLGLKLPGLEEITIEKLFRLEEITIEKLFGLEEIIRAKRDKPISKGDVKKIVDYIGGQSVLFFDPQYKQHEYNKKQIIDVLKKQVE